LELEAVTHPEAMRMLLDHVYGADSEVTYMPTADAVNRDILRMAVGFGFPSLKENATQWMVKDVTLDNCAERLATCEEFGFEDLYETIKAVADEAAAAEEAAAAAAEAADGASEDAEESASKEEADCAQQADNDEPEEETPDVEEAKRAMQTVYYARDEPVPADSKEGYAWPTSTDAMKVFARLQETFEERPAWLLSSLKAEMPASVDEDMLLRLLPLVAYQWSDGPWQRCYCLLGWDPRADSENAMKHQVFVFRDTHLRGQDSESKAAAKNQIVDPFFKKPPTRYAQDYQLVDINDGFVQDLLEDSEAQPECNKKDGWFADYFMDAIKNRLSYKSNQMRERFAAKAEKAAAVTKASAKSRRSVSAAPAAKRRKTVGGC